MIAIICKTQMFDRFVIEKQPKRIILLVIIECAFVMNKTWQNHAIQLFYNQAILPYCFKYIILAYSLIRNTIGHVRIFHCSTYSQRSTTKISKIHLIYQKKIWAINKSVFNSIDMYWNERSIWVEFHILYSFKNGLVLKSIYT